MKVTTIVIFLVMAILAAGCTGTAPVPAPSDNNARATPVVYPDLKGTWTGPIEGYDKGTGYSTYPGITVTINVTEQHGRIFGGTILVSRNSSVTPYGFAGAIGRDGRSIYIAEEDGTYNGEVVNGDEIELIYLQAGSQYSAAIDTFRRI